MDYESSRSEDVPEELKSAFQKWVSEHTDEAVMIYGEEQSVEWLTRQLWNCTDVLPGSTCDALNLPPGSTYAQAAQRVQETRSGTE
jgi:hypothetical protein